MSIEIIANLHPGGNHQDERWLATIRIWSSEDGQLHRYSIDLGARDILTGAIPKARSAHQNILHVIQAVLKHAKIDHLGVDYIPRGGA